MGWIPEQVKKWWEIANERRQVLITKKHMGGGLTSKEECEYQMLQKVADCLLEYGDALIPTDPGKRTS